MLMTCSVEKVRAYSVLILLFMLFPVIPVKLGIVGLVNRSQLDITNNKVKLIVCLLVFTVS